MTPTQSRNTREDQECARSCSPPRSRQACVDCLSHLTPHATGVRIARPLSQSLPISAHIPPHGSDFVRPRSGCDDHWLYSLLVLFPNSRDYVFMTNSVLRKSDAKPAADAAFRRKTNFCNGLEGNTVRSSAWQSRRSWLPAVTARDLSRAVEVSRDDKGCPRSERKEQAHTTAKVGLMPNR